MEPPKKRAKWSQEQLRRAMDAVRGGSSVRSASVNYGIPRRTLRNHVTSGVSQKRLGRPTVLTAAQETDLCERIFRLCDIGMPLTSKLLKRSVFAYCQLLEIPHPFSEDKKTAGRKWFRLFLKRHPNVARRKALQMNAAWAAKLNKFIVNDHFGKLRNILEAMNIMNKPHLIFNMDEKGCRLTLHKQPEVLAKRGCSNVHIIAEEHAENVTIVACGNAIGQVIPPMILMKGKREKQEWSENLPPGAVIKMTEKGSMNTSTFVTWIKHFSQFKPNEKVLLIFDGASSHLDFSIVEEADKHDITLYCLPSNTTHQLQPMDKSVFGPFESYWDNEVLLFWTNMPNHRITKLNFGTIFSKAWPRAVTPSNVSAGFRATGIYPFDPNVIPDSVFAPSELTMRRTSNTENEIMEIRNDEQEHATETIPKIITNKRRNEQKLGVASKIKQKLPESCPSGIQKPNKNLKKIRSLSSSSMCEAGPSGLQKTNANLKKIRETSSSSNSDSPSDYSVRDSSSGEESFSSYIGKSSPIKERSPEQESDNVATFKNVLPRPELEEKKITPRKKSLNYRAQKVTKDLFKENEQKDQTISKTNKSKPNKKTKKVLEKWYCHICDEDEVANIRLCKMCLRYVHEDCVGLTVKDKESFFICPSCSK